MNLRGLARLRLSKNNLLSAKIKAAMLTEEKVTADYVIRTFTNSNHSHRNL